MKSTLPKYLVIKNDLVEKINSEQLKVDEMIPSERELIEKYNVSRITVRKAVEELANEGYLYKIQGKGTFVKGYSRITDLSRITSCTTEIMQQGFNATREIVSASVVPCRKKIARDLNIESGDTVLHLERIFFADNEPVNYINNYIPCQYFEDIDKIDFNKYSLYEVFQNEYHVNINGSIRYIEVVRAYEDVADFLEVAEGYPLLHFHGITEGLVAGKLLPVEAFSSFYITDKIKFYIQQK